MDKIERLKEIIEQELTEYQGHEGVKDEALEIVENLTSDNNDFNKVCPPHERCLLWSGLNPVYGCRKCRLPEDEWEDKPVQKS